MTRCLALSPVRLMRRARRSYEQTMTARQYEHRRSDRDVALQRGILGDWR